TRLLGRDGLLECGGLRTHSSGASAPLAACGRLVAARGLARGLHRDPAADPLAALTPALATAPDPVPVAHRGDVEEGPSREARARAAAGPRRPGEGAGGETGISLAAITDLKSASGHHGRPAAIVADRGPSARLAVEARGTADLALAPDRRPDLARGPHHAQSK